MAKIYLPTRMRTFADLNTSVEVKGSTIKELFDSLLNVYPKLESQLLDESKEINKFTKVFINETDISQLQGENSEVSEKDSVHIIQAMAGG